ncbi:MAG: alcohol dehydrogenase catalytic domain-containing protein [Planctomycetes bacterium]|nr:alcohol dehydrogenase catalytic domain-containing protein [Planctomycetota bacterium]
MRTIAFDAFDYCADRTFAPARYRFVGDEHAGWDVARDGQPVLRLGPGYRALRVRSCGVCSTDLARHFLPFPLPQVIGHEVVAVDDAGRRFVVEINASHVARGVAHDCAFCRAGLPTHCRERITLGIHDLPGGFGPWILAPVDACLEVPATIPDSVAVLVEPFAAALHAVRTIAPRSDERIAVLGPRRLGMLVVAALAAVRGAMQKHEHGFEIAALVRDPALAPMARAFGATATHVLPAAAAALDRAFDVVIDTTGNPEGLVHAVGFARREVHLKSTHGQPAVGLRHLTELVVDELGIARFPRTAPLAGDEPWTRLRTGARARVAWLAAAEPPAWLATSADVRRGTATELAEHYAATRDGLPRADVAVVDSPGGVDAVIRPRADREESLVRPRGLVLMHPYADSAGSALLAAVTGRDLRLTSSRCGDFRDALALLAQAPQLARLGERLVTHTFAAGDLAHAFTVARSRACIKAVVTQDPASP